MIKTVVLGLKDASEFILTGRHSLDKIAVISITLSDIPFEGMSLPHLIIRREDVDEKWPQESIDHYGGLFGIEDGIMVKNFVEKHLNKVDYFLIHCDAGVSRSRAVAAALELVYNGNDGEHFKKGVPNRTVYKEVLKAHGLSNDYTEVESPICFMCGRNWALESGLWNSHLGTGRTWHVECDNDYKEYLKEEQYVMEDKS